MSQAPPSSFSVPGRKVPSEVYAPYVGVVQGQTPDLAVVGVVLASDLDLVAAAFGEAGVVPVEVVQRVDAALDRIAVEPRLAHADSGAGAGVGRDGVGADRRFIIVCDADPGHSVAYRRHPGG